MGWGTGLAVWLTDKMIVTFTNWSLTTVAFANAVDTSGTVTNTALTKTDWLTGWLTELGRRTEGIRGLETGSGALV